MAAGNLGKRGEPHGIGRALTEIGERPRNEVALVDGIEQLDRAHDFKARKGIAAIRRGSGGGRRAMSLWPSLARAIWP